MKNTPFALFLSIGALLTALSHPLSALADQSALNSQLRFVSRQGLLNEVQKLLAEGAEINSQGEHGETALQYAARFGHHRVVRELIAQGADASLTDFDDRSPLILASMACSPRSTRELLKAGARVNQEDHHGSTALTIASELGCVKQVHSLLAVKGIQIEHQDDQQKSALDYARAGWNFMGDPYGPILAELRARLDSKVSTRTAPIAVAAPLQLP